MFARIETLENTRSEATSPANFTQVLTSESEASSAPDVTESIVETEPLLIIEEIEDIAAPTIENTLPDETLSDAISAIANPILSRTEALAIAQNFGFIGKGQNLYDWSKASLTSKSDESKKANSEKLAAVGLVAAFTPENKPAWKIKTLS
ncbi:hypothetical protein [Pseudanabaena sp. BC1403]|uniref:hypothetical protein n=1 Tax=Pseudanabaena sp. BC1403 TaxID=2043171 RepID=UPI000CD8CBCC|nr:hypothetical protein [Pseudanabaena sp. BC1403]